MRDTVVLHPGLGVGHLAPMVELARLFLRRGLAVTVVVVEPPDAPSEVARAAAANPSISFHVLPLPAPPGAVSPAAAEQEDPPPPRNPFAFLRRANAPLRDYLRSVLPTVRALVLDIFCIDALDVAAGLGVPAYLFYTSSASTLAVSLHMPHMQAEVDASFGDIGDALLCFPGVPPFRPKELPENALDRDNEVYRKFLHAFGRIPESRGILVNTFEWLEARAVAALRDGACVPGRPTPPVYCVGPLVSGGGGEVNRHACLQWLDEQPENSVVFLCFGSMGSFPKKQLEAIAIGLEMSGQRFLWVVRSPRRDGASSSAGDHQLPEPDLDELLPVGFLARTEGRGLVVKSWAPQADVLRHRATGAFVTHCGWNSTLEGITAAVPLLCWPLYAEQRLNKVFIVEAARVGVEMAGYDRDREVVAAEEVESKVRWLMESEEGRALRGRRAALAKEKALEALQQGGTSYNALLEFVRDLDRGASL
ncbi:Anthocyanidin 5,3-O-glucosyltransferase [Dichanthelium oligosanthes]|uniref:Glycosyltransferase n=1 Tax=Dichanthelium oligosanthes TaxID=888268 RepID=A0A1E5VSF2_9POAL|nr:Anthocyanidin 5,3-O-glucosyltransferase [Dichanthelium oligosanthes]